METNGSTVENCSEMDLANLDDSDHIYSDMPAQVEKHLDFVTVNSSGNLLMGSSNLTGRYWCGSVWYYTDPALAPEIEGSKAGTEFTGGVTDCVFIDDKRAVVGEDGGIVNFLSINDCDSCAQIVKTQQIDDHGYAVIGVKLTSNAKTIVTASMDMSIRLWDCHTTACTHNFTPAHTQEITSIATHPSHPEIFLSSALDGNVFIWDLRCPKPASCIFRDVDDCPSSVSWIPTKGADSFNYVVGTVSGQLHLRDSRVISHSLSTIHPYKRAIFRITPNRFRHNEIAVCANESEVMVFNIKDEKIKTSYEDDRHSDFVRGLEWLGKNRLITCGWDKKVFQHHIPERDPS